MTNRRSSVSSAKAAAEQAAGTAVTILTLALAWFACGCKMVKVIDDVGAAFDADLDRGGEPLDEAGAEADIDRQDVFLGEGLVAYYRFDEGSGAALMDSSGNDVEAQLFGSPQWVEGIFGDAVAFDGVNTFADTFCTVHLPQFSVSTWVKGAAVPGDDKDTGPVMKQENFLISWDHRGDAYRGAAALRANDTWHGAGYGELQADTWYHLAATYDGDSLNAYRDGQLVTSNGTPSGNAGSSEHSMKIARHAVNEFYFNGTVDETRVYNRALTAGEVMELYHAIR